MIYKEQRAKLLQALLDLRRKERLVAQWEERRKKTGKSAGKFCKDSRIPHPSYSRWINGAQEPEPDKIAKVESALMIEGV